MPGKHGPHGELFFFLIQKEQAIAPSNETFSPFINADIRPPASPLMFSRSVRSSLCIWDEWKMGCQNSPMWESDGGAW